MAELTVPPHSHASGRSHDPDAGNGHRPASAADSGAVTPAPVDPRAVRVRLSASSQLGEEPAVVVAPVPPVTAPLPEEGTVLAQRQVLVDGLPVEASVRVAGGGRYLLDEVTGTTRVVLEPEGPSGSGGRLREVLVDGFRFMVEVESERLAALRERASQGRASAVHSGPLLVRAIIPGKVVAISVNPGDAVTAGQQLLVVEAMKMQNELRAPRDGTIDRVGVGVGVNIEIGDLLVVIS